MANGYGFSGSNQGLTGEELARRDAVSDALNEKTREKRLARIAEIQDQIYDVTTEVLLANIQFYEVDFDATEPPAEWVEKYGEKLAKQRLIVAKSGYLPASQAPSAIKLAQMVHSSITRSMGHEKGRGQLNQINVKIALPAPTSQEHPGSEVYEIIDIDG
jgi:hypothetical protein